MSDKDQEIRVVLGDEYDEKLKKVLVAAIGSLGGAIVKKSSGVGGSQELFEAVAEIGSFRVDIESETYVGLSIAGPKSIIDKLIAIVAEAMKSSK